MLTRRRFVQLAGAGVGAACAGGCVTTAGKPGGLAGCRPNIIFVLTDDQGYGDLGCHGHPYLKTPNLDRLYTQSTRLTDYHVSPTCAPTRSALLTGKSPFANGITHTILERERMALSSTTLAQVLKTAGYATGVFGKWHLGDEDAYQPHSRGFDETFIHGGGGIGQAYPGSCADAPGNTYFDPVIRHNNTMVKTQGYCTDVFFQQALGWIREHREGPFFAYIPTNAPHGPFICPDRYKKPYAKLSKSDRTASFYGMIANIDQNMGVLMAKLEAWGIADNTLLVFMTDNGSSAGDFAAGMKGKKGSPHEGGSRVPAFFRLPGRIKAGRDVERLTRHIDMFPTLAALAGADLPGGVEGRSLLPLFEDPAATWVDRNTFFHVGRWGKKGHARWGRGHCDPDRAKYEKFAVRNERWRLVGKDELYDIAADPGQARNVIAEHPSVAKGMLAAYDAWWERVRPSMVNEDVPLTAARPFHVLYEEQAAGGIPAWVPPKL